jgi:hypothetical protein
MIVRFAVVCDQCGKKGPEYQGGINCSECGDDICESCAERFDYDPPTRGVCKRCQAEANACRAEREAEMRQGGIGR